MLLSFTQIGKGMHNLNRRLANRWYRKDKHCSSQVYNFAETTTIGFIGIFIFIIAPSVIVSEIEDWTFDEGVYFAVISLSTVGFGDYVAGTCCLSQYKDLSILCQYCKKYDDISKDPGRVCKIAYQCNPKSHEISLAHGLSISYPIVLILWTEYDSDTALPCAKFEIDWTLERHYGDVIMGTMVYLIKRYWENARDQHWHIDIYSHWNFFYIYTLLFVNKLTF